MADGSLETTHWKNTQREIISRMLSGRNSELVVKYMPGTDEGMLKCEKIEVPFQSKTVPVFRIINDQCIDTDGIRITILKGTIIVTHDWGSLRENYTQILAFKDELHAQLTSSAEA